MSDNITINTGQEGSALDQIKAYGSRLKSGEMGALPAIGALILLVALFSTLSPYFLTVMNFANLLNQAATLMMLSAALVFVIMLGEIDLSAGVTAGTGMAIFVKLNLEAGKLCACICIGSYHWLGSWLLRSKDWCAIFRGFTCALLGFPGCCSNHSW